MRCCRSPASVSSRSRSANSPTKTRRFRSRPSRPFLSPISLPDTLKDQLKIGGRMVIPVGSDPRAQELVRVTRLAKDDFESEDIADVRFVPLIGEEGWLPEKGKLASFARPLAKRQRADEDI